MACYLPVYRKINPYKRLHKNLSTTKWKNFWVLFEANPCLLIGHVQLGWYCIQSVVNRRLRPLFSLTILIWSNKQKRINIARKFFHPYYSKKPKKVFASLRHSSSLKSTLKAWFYGHRFSGKPRFSGQYCYDGTTVFTNSGNFNIAEFAVELL